jgi:hypothetical protein
MSPRRSLFAGVLRSQGAMSPCRRELRRSGGRSATAERLLDYNLEPGLELLAELARALVDLLAELDELRLRLQSRR